MRLLLVPFVVLFVSACAEQSRFVEPTNRADRMLHFVERDRRNEAHPLSSEPEEDPDTTTRVPNPALVDIESLIEIGVRKPAGEPARRILGADAEDMMADKAAMLALLDELSDVVEARKAALRAFNDGRPSEDFDRLVTEAGTATRGFILEFRNMFPRDSEAYRQATRSVGDGGIQKLKPFLQQKIDEIESRDSRVQARARSRGSSLSLQAFLDSPGSELSAVHLRGYDSLPEGRLVSRDRYGINLTAQEREDLARQMQATEDLARTLESIRIEEISLQEGAFDALEIVAPELADLVEDADEIADRLRDPARFQGMKDNLEQAAEDAKQQASNLTTGLEARIDALPDTLAAALKEQADGIEAILDIVASIRQIQSDWEAVRASPTLAGLPELMFRLNSTRNGIDEALTQMPVWVQQASDISLSVAVSEAGGIQADAADAFTAIVGGDSATGVVTDARSYVADIRRGVNVIRQISAALGVTDINVATTAPDVPESFSVDIEQLQDTALDLRRVPGRVGDTIVVKGTLSTPGRDPIETSATFELTRYGHYARLVPSVVLVRPDEVASGADEFRFAPALGWMHHYRPRPTETGWFADMMRPLQVAAGLHAIFLNFDNEAGIGLGGSLSFWNDRLQFGAGYNLSASSSDDGEYYFFVGSDLIGLLQTVGIGN